MESRDIPSADMLSQLVVLVKESKKYKTISEVLIRRIAAQELTKYHNLRAAEKATRNKLHQIGGAYIDRPVNYDDCFSELKAAFLSGKDDFLRACQHVMCYHSSTRERLPELDEFYRSLLADLPAPQSVLDIACGLNPLAIPWMGFRDVVKYFAVDIYSDMIVFINQFMKLTGISGSATVGDVISQCPTQPVDIAFLLKTIPCLEQVDKTAGIQLLTQLNAGYILVSFPIHSLGGRRDKGMLENYSRRFQEQTAGNDWSITKFEFSSELVFVVKK